MLSLLREYLFDILIPNGLYQFSIPFNTLEYFAIGLHSIDSLRLIKLFPWKCFRVCFFFLGGVRGDCQLWKILRLSCLWWWTLFEIISKRYSHKSFNIFIINFFPVVFQKKKEIHCYLIIFNLFIQYYLTETSLWINIEFSKSEFNVVLFIVLCIKKKDRINFFLLYSFFLR